MLRRRAFVQLVLLVCSCWTCRCQNYVAFTVQLDDRMSLPPGVSGADLMQSAHFQEHVTELVAGSLHLPEGTVEASEVQVDGVEVLDDTNTQGTNAYGSSIGGTKRIRVTSTVFVFEQALAMALENLEEVSLAGIAPLRKLTIVQSTM
mmetsp:Transcript_49702/g.111845  ORF Transcript_49702/g.111845 Transcript_49702/m.111845 type:complete len:148 (-) Transcript_49702:76-519(-)